jgi:hypothetical protein
LCISSSQRGSSVRTRNVHEVAQEVNPAAYIVYVDNDPVVLLHAQALMTSAPEGQVASVEWDLRYGDPDELLSDAVSRATVDLGEPVAVLLVGVLPFILDEHEPAKTIQAMVDLLPQGSFVAASHLSADHDPIGAAATVEAYHEGGIPMQLREPGEFEGLAFPGLELLPPGVVPVSQWRTTGGVRLPSADGVRCYGAVARKP